MVKNINAQYQLTIYFFFLLNIRGSSDHLSNKYFNNIIKIHIFV